MSRLNSTLIALVLGATAAAGLFAAVRTVRLGQSASAAQTVSATPKEIATRRAKLMRWSHSLERARAKHPPALPKIPKFAPVPVPETPAPAPAPATTPAAPPVKYVRPAPTVKYQQAAPPTTTTSTRSSWADDGHESSSTESGDD